MYFKTLFYLFFSASFAVFSQNILYLNTGKVAEIQYTKSEPGFIYAKSIDKDKIHEIRFPIAIIDSFKCDDAKFARKVFKDSPSMQGKLVITATYTNYVKNEIFYGNKDFGTLSGNSFDNQKVGFLLAQGGKYVYIGIGLQILSGIILSTLLSNNKLSVENKTLPLTVAVASALGGIGFQILGGVKISQAGKVMQGKP